MRDLIDLMEALDYDLKAKYQYYNRLAFDGRLPDIPITWATLKGVGGVAEAKYKFDPSKPPVNRLLVRLGRQDRLADHTLIPGTVRIRISQLYQRSERATDMILLHEMIHVDLMTTGWLGEGHGERFKAEQRRVSEVVGFDVPLTDNVKGFEFAVEVKLRAIGVVVINTRDGGYQYAVFPAAVVETMIEAIRERSTYFVKHNYWKSATVYTITDQLWSDQAMKTTVQRKFGMNTGYRPLTDQALINDLRQHGKVLAEITKAD